MGVGERTYTNVDVALQTRRSIEKLLEWENSRLYHKVSSNMCVLIVNLRHAVKMSDLYCTLFAVVFALETKQKEV